MLVNKIKFTIAICTHNGAMRLGIVLDSILGLCSFDELVFEVLVIDNASTDSTKEIVLCYADQCKKIKYVFEPKLGLSNARRRAIFSPSDWIIYVDDDNVLDSSWLIELEHTIQTSKQNVGIINGAVIATPVDELTELEEIRLNTMYRNLACTHIRSITYPALPNKEPMGAGLCIKTDGLKIVAEKGWLNLIGRTGENLSSGEDSELCEKIMALGYEYVCNYSMILYHIIPKSRLSEEYTDRLLKGLIRSRFILISGRRLYILQRIFRYLKYEGIRLVEKFRRPKNLLEKELSRERIIVSNEFVRCCYVTRFIKRELNE